MFNKIKTILIALTCVAIGLCLFACTPAELNLSTRSVTVTVGESVTVDAVASKGDDVVWTTDNDEVVLVQGGVITALREGTAKVTATAGEISATVNVTVRAAKQYTVTVDGAAQVVTEGDLLSKPADPVKAADAQYTYAFEGWFIAGTQTEWDFASPVTRALVLESRFTKTVNEYGVTIGGETEMVAYGSLIEKPADPVMDESAQYLYTFDGWFIAGTDTEWKFKTDKVTGAVSLEPRFTETVKTYTVKVNGVTSFVKYGETVAAPSYVPEKEASATKIYTFDKWVIEGTNTEWIFSTATVTGDVNIVASFVETDRKFTVSFVIDGEEALRTEGKAHGDKITAPESPEKAADDKNVYTFDGWYVAGTATKWDFDKAIDGAMVSGDEIRLVANFVSETRKVTVTLKGGEAVTEKSVAYGSVLNLPTPVKADDELNSYVFGGWVTEQGEKFGSQPVTEDITLTATFVAQPKAYTVTVLLDSGKMVKLMTVKGGSKATEPVGVVKASTLSTEFTFDKWINRATGEEWKWDTAITSDVTVIATFTESVKQYTVTINGEQTLVNYGEKIARPEDATKEDDATNSYEFDKWLDKSTGAEWNFESGVVNRDIELIATFIPTALKYYVVFDGGEKIVYEYGTKVAKPADPVKEADAQFTYTFSHWKIEGRSHIWNFDKDVIEDRWLAKKTLSLEPVYTETLNKYEVTVSYNGEIVLEGTYDYGTKLTCPVANPTKAPTVSTVYVFEGWYNGDAAWDFDSTVVTGPTAIVAVFGEEGRKYDYTLTFTTEKMNLAGVTDYTLFDVDYSVVNVTAKSGDKTFTAVNGADSVVLSIPAGDYTVTVKYKNATYEKNITTGNADKTDSMYLKQIVDVGGKMIGSVGGKTYAYPSFAYSRVIGENSVSFSGISYVYLGEEITDTYYLEADVELASVGRMIGIMGASTFGNISNDNDKTLQGDDDRLKHKLVFSFSGGNAIYRQHDNGWGGAGITSFVPGVNTSVATAASHKLAVARKGNDYYVFLNDILFGHYYTNAYGKAGFGFCDANGGSASFTNIKYTVKPEVVDAVLAKYDTGAFLGGSFTYPNGKTYKSFGANWTLTSHNSGTIKGPSYLYASDMVGSTYYLECTFDNTANWVGLLANTLDAEPQINKGWMAFGRYGSAAAGGSSLTTYFHKYHGGWSSGDGLGNFNFPAGDWKMGIARVNRKYYVYLNDTLWKTYSNVVAHTTADNSVELPADNASGFGIFCGGNFSNTSTFKNFWATTDAAAVQAKIAELAK